jgi:exonuclease VII large subunit
LVRAVANFPVPVITGIGHDKDLPLVSFISDKNVSTPTAVANLLNSSWRDALSLVKLSEEKIFSNFSSALSSKKFFIENSVIRMEKGMKAVIDFIRQTEELIIEKVEDRIQEIKTFIEQTSKTLLLVDPKRQLKRGYSIVRSKKGVATYRAYKKAQAGKERLILGFLALLLGYFTILSIIVPLSYAMLVVWILAPEDVSIEVVDISAIPMYDQDKETSFPQTASHKNCLSPSLMRCTFARQGFDCAQV